MTLLNDLNRWSASPGPISSEPSHISKRTRFKISFIHQKPAAERTGHWAATLVAVSPIVHPSARSHSKGLLKMNLQKTTVLFLIILFLSAMNTSRVGAQEKTCRETALRLVSKAAYKNYTAILNSDRTYTKQGPTPSLAEFKSEYISLSGEIPTIFHSIVLYEVSEDYSVSGADVVCCSADSTFIVDLAEDYPGLDSLKVRKTLSLLNYFVQVEGEREYTTNELISIIELGLTIQRFLFDHEMRTYPRILTYESVAWNELEADVLSQENLLDSVTLRKKEEYVSGVIDSSLSKWIDFSFPRIKPPFAVTTSNGLEITAYTLLLTQSVQRNVFLWSNGRFTLKSQELLKKCAD